MSEQNENVRGRIFAAADELYAANQRLSFPTVDAVRKRAKVNMNDASTGMKEWRRAQSACANVVAAPLPNDLQSQAVAILAKFWDEANRQATTSLLAAQSGWEAERHESDELARQMAAAYDAQAAELASTLEECSRLRYVIDGLRSEIQALAEKLSSTTRDREEVQRLLDESTMKATEANKRVDGLQQAADHARADTIHVRGEIETARKAHAEQLERIRNECGQELEKERARSERERQRYEELAIRATAEAAHLRGKLDALESSNVPAPGRAASRRKKEKTDAGVLQQESNR
jgi:chromosome segregation ATPase